MILGLLVFIFTNEFYLCDRSLSDRAQCVYPWMNELIKCCGKINLNQADIDEC